MLVGGDLDEGFEGSEISEPLELEGTMQAATADEAPKFRRGEDQGSDGIGIKLVRV